MAVHLLVQDLTAAKGVATLEGLEHGLGAAVACGAVRHVRV
jgi:hypothetical protein